MDSLAFSLSLSVSLRPPSVRMSPISEDDKLQFSRNGETKILCSAVGGAAMVCSRSLIRSRMTRLRSNVDDKNSSSESVESDKIYAALRIIFAIGAPWPGHRHPRRAVVLRGEVSCRCLLCDRF